MSNTVVTPPLVADVRTTEESPMRRSRAVLLVLALSALAAASGSGAVTDSATLAVDECGLGPDAEDVTLDAHDVCDATVTVTQAVDEGARRDPSGAV